VQRPFGFSLLAVPAQCSHVTVADPFLSLFIPQAVGERFQAGEECDTLDVLKERFRFVALLQIIVGIPGLK